MKVTQEKRADLMLLQAYLNKFCSYDHAARYVDYVIRLHLWRSGNLHETAITQGVCPACKEPSREADVSASGRTRLRTRAKGD